MVVQSVNFPTPFGRIDFISLTEPNGETEGEMHFVHRLYMVNRFAEGGKVLVAQRRGDPLPKNIGAHPASDNAGKV